MAASASAMSQSNALITSTGTGRNACACANGLRFARLATTGTTALVPANAAPTCVQLTSTGMPSSASACVKKLNAHLIKFGTHNAASAFAYPSKTAIIGLITGTSKAAHANALRSKFVTQITSGIPYTVSASASNSRYVPSDKNGIPSLANVTTANIVTAQVSLSGNNHLASAYVRTH